MNYEKIWPWIAGALLLLLIVSPIRPNPPTTTYEDLVKEVIPSEGFTLPVQWGNLGKQMVESGVIDAEKFISLYEQRGGMTEEMNQLLLGEHKGNLAMNKENSGFILNLLWASGLSNQNIILTEGPMADSKYGGSDRFASTGGWRLAKGNTMEHYSAHMFISLTLKQQELVERVSKNIYRPCCNNSTYFPDCNHGMAMLGLLELMASQDIGEDKMYIVALQVNSYWFSDTYLAIAKYFALRGVSWKEINPKEILGSLYSSATGYQQILAEIEPIKNQGGGCGV